MREAMLLAEGAAALRMQRQDDLTAAAWTGAALARAKRLPPLRELLTRKPKRRQRQSDEEIRQALRAQRVLCR